MDAFYVPEGDDVFASTVHTRGPWGPDAQHGGPPAALVGRAVERTGNDDMQVARINFEILRPVPIVSLTVRARVVRPGKRVQMLEAELTAGGETLMRATAWQIRRTELDLEAIGVAAPPGAGPDEGATDDTLPHWEGGSYISSIEWRFVKGGFSQPGPATAWTRMRYPLVADEEPSPLTRVLVAADSGSGISSTLDFARWMFINPDLTVYLHRLPRTDWVCLDSATTIEPSGIGLATTAISDEDGALGRGLQSLFVSERR